MFFPCFIGLVLGKMKQKKCQTWGDSWPYKWLSIEGGFKPSAHYAVNYSVVYQIRYVQHKFLSFFVLSAILLYCGWLLGSYLVNSLSRLMLIFGHWECCNKVGFLSQAKWLVWFELRTFWFDHSTLTQSATLPKKHCSWGLHILHASPLYSFFYFQTLRWRFEFKKGKK